MTNPTFRPLPTLSPPPSPAPISPPPSPAPLSPSPFSAAGLPRLIEVRGRLPSAASASASAEVSMRHSDAGNFLRLSRPGEEYQVKRPRREDGEKVALQTENAALKTENAALKEQLEMSAQQVQALKQQVQQAQQQVQASRLQLQQAQQQMQADRERQSRMPMGFPLGVQQVPGNLGRYWCLFPDRRMCQVPLMDIFALVAPQLPVGSQLPPPGQPSSSK